MKIFEDNTALPKLAEEWFWQCGTVSGFRNFDPARQKLFTNLNLGLHKNAPINDMAAEIQVQCISYELKNISNQSLDCASLSNVKA